MHGLSVTRTVNARDRGLGLVYFGAAVAFLVDVGVSLQVIRLRVGGRFEVDRLGEGQFESVGLAFISSTSNGTLPVQSRRSRE